MPDIVCWSRMQAEAGQGLLNILRRKELERQACGAVFFWGVGNAPSRATQSLVAAELTVPVVFSVMRSIPKAHDVAPSAILIWRSYIDQIGVVQPLPSGALVTSRYRGGDQPKHYALMCQSEDPLCISDHGGFDPAAYRNLSGSGGQIAASQVTALAIRVAKERRDAPYRRDMRAQLFGSFWVKLSDPLVIAGDELKRVVDQLSQENLIADDWLNIVSDIKVGQGLYRQSEPSFPLLGALH